MADLEFKHDLAFSLLDTDEGIAREIRRLLPESLEVFLYTERQAEIVGTDGLEKFSEVFGRDSRAVAILYRRGWGTTRFTSLESDAIRTRRFHEGPDFLTLVRLDEEPIPAWIPHNRIWADYSRLGSQGVAAVLAERITAQGKAVREESAIEFGARVRREQEAAAKKRAFLESQAGVQAANRAADEIFEEFKAIGTANGAEVTCQPNACLMYQNGAGDLTSVGRFGVPKRKSFVDTNSISTSPLPKITLGAKVPATDSSLQSSSLIGPQDCC